MLKIVWPLFVLLFATVADARGRGGGSSVSVGGHIRKSGAYVIPHVRTAPDKTQRNNWGSIPNVNPYTGKAGTKQPTR